MAGMTLTIEPILALGSPRVICWPDGWTNVTADGNGLLSLVRKENILAVMN